uniref:Hsp70 family protein n=1 Tax=Thaumasiovibrio occultus TaxID=1891184 RepID=UPI000B35713A|nr:Hsp70 family protein [Thaumasiovibrio occultus]
MSSLQKYYVGIDLGTTHTVVAFSALNDESKSITLFPIDQLVGPGVVARKPLLPSFRYHPTAADVSAKDCVLPWVNQPVSGDLDNAIIGEWARELGAKVAGRLVSSAKSWLSHTGVDRSAPVLPWGGASDVQKVSPLIASASYLNHIHQCWNYHHPDAPLAEQLVVITIPASFDETARQFTLEAAKLAGLHKINLLEEPQAACYDWYHRNEDNAKALLANHPLTLVCDVGGGTTDLSLIAATIKDDELALERIGVGEHLMLGGDNIDLTLAHLAEQQIGDNKPVSASMLSKLVQQTRKSKEQLLSANAPESVGVTLLGRGRSLIGGSQKATLHRDQVVSAVEDGFFPQSELAELPPARLNAVREFGLPYASNAAITQHIASFIMLHQNASHAAVGNVDSEHVIVPNAVLYNGGLFNSPRLKARVSQQLAQWAQADITELDNPHPDHAVARGAVAYSMARQGRLLKIGGGSARPYYLEVIGAKGVKQGLCLLPKGSEEGTAFHLSGREFALRLGEPIKFNILTHHGDASDKVGELVALDDSYLLLPPLITTLADERAERSTQQFHERVTLVSKYTELGTLSVSCQSKESDRQWQLEFELRQEQGESAASDVKGLDEAKALIDTVFGNQTAPDAAKQVKQLRQTLEKTLGDKESWPLPVLRELAASLLKGLKRRRRSEQHEKQWLKLTGHCLRPGFGFPADEWRMSQVWPLFQMGIQYQSAQTWTDWWVFWRRVAGGLSADQQATIYKQIRKYLQPAAARNKTLQAERQAKGYEEMVRLAASLEKLPLDTKMQLIESLFSQLQKSQHEQAHWWAIGRIASRSALGGHADKLMPAAHAEYLLGAILDEDWIKQPHIGFCAVMIARKTGDRALDVSDELRASVSQKLLKIKAPQGWQSLLEQETPLSIEQSQRLFGDSLPSGLALIN